MDSQRLARFVDAIWEDEIVPQITDYIRIPCLLYTSPSPRD